VAADLLGHPAGNLAIAGGLAAFAHTSHALRRAQWRELSGAAAALWLRGLWRRHINNVTRYDK
jgi:hypothetical protein